MTREDVVEVMAQATHKVAVMRRTARAEYDHALTVEALHGDLRRAAQQPKRELVAKVKREYPAAYARVRAACQWTSNGIDLDEHAARIVLSAVNSRRAA